MPSAKPKVYPPWKIACLRWMKNSTTFDEIYRRMGWSYGIVTTRNKKPDMRVSQAAMLADALGVPRGQFLAMIAEYTIGQPCPMDPRLSRAVPIPEKAVKQRRSGPKSGPKNPRSSSSART